MHNGLCITAAELMTMIRTNTRVMKCGRRLCAGKIFFALYGCPRWCARREYFAGIYTEYILSNRRKRDHKKLYGCIAERGSEIQAESHHQSPGHVLSGLLRA